MLGATGSQDTTEENGSVVDAPCFSQHAKSNLPSSPEVQSHLLSCVPLEDDGYDLMLELTTMLLSTLKVHKNLMKQKFLKLVMTLQHQTVLDRVNKVVRLSTFHQPNWQNSKFLSLNKSWQRGGNLLMASRWCCWRG